MTDERTSNLGWAIGVFGWCLTFHTVAIFLLWVGGHSCLAYVLVSPRNSFLEPAVHVIL